MTAPVMMRSARKIAPARFGGTGPTGNAVDRFADFGREATQGFADQAGQDFTKQVGGLLGNLNSIGGLRSGGTVAGVNDLTTNFGRQVGSEAAKNALAVAQVGQQEGASLRSDAQTSAALANQKDEFGRSLAETTAGRVQQNEQFGRGLAQSESQFGRGLAETTAGRMQTGDLTREGYGVTRRGQDINQDQFGRDLAYRTRGQDIQVDQFGRQLKQTGDIAMEGFGVQRRGQDISHDEFGQNLGERQNEFTQTQALEEKKYAEDVRRYGQDRADRIQAEKNAKKGGFFKTLGGILGGVAGAVIPGLGLAGKAVGAVSRAAPVESAYGG